MTSVERHRSTHHLISDATPTSQRSSSNGNHSLPTPIIRRIPPAVPSPPSQRGSPTPPHRDLRYARTPPTTSKMSSDTSNQWLFTEAELASTPTILDGVAPADERCRRAKGVNFIIQAGIMLKLPQLTLATASVFFHRYYMRISMAPEKGGQHHYNIAATALFLATKTEENCRKTKEIVIAVAKVAAKNPTLIIDEQAKEYWRWRDNLLTFEEHMLEMLTFDVVLTPPYTYLYRFLHQLGIEDSKPLRNLAWVFINDSCLTTLCLLMPPQDIAVAAIYFAAHISREVIEDGPNGEGWWELVNGTPNKILKAVSVMNSFWTENPLGRTDNPYVMSPLPNEDDMDLTRKPKSDGSIDHTPSPAERRNSSTSRNGYSQENGTVNGKRQEVKTKQESPVKPQDIPAPTIETDKVDVAKVAEAPGSSDAALKEAANDPAVHEQTQPQNGLAASIGTDAPKPSPKRKSRDEEDESPLTKRVKSGTKLDEPPSDGRIEQQEGDEEGELAES